MIRLNVVPFLVVSLFPVIPEAALEVSGKISDLILQPLEFFVQLAFNLSSGVTDTLESSTILIYSKSHVSLYTQMVRRMPC
jgi:hypothetical protein